MNTTLVDLLLTLQAESRSAVTPHTVCEDGSCIVFLALIPAVVVVIVAVVVAVVLGAVLHFKRKSEIRPSPEVNEDYSR